MIFKNKHYFIGFLVLVIIIAVMFWVYISYPTKPNTDEVIAGQTELEQSAETNAQGGIIEMAQNPIIWADVPDPSVIRVENEYYMVSTTMHMKPGAPIKRSTDLVNWEIIGYVFDRLEENDTYRLHRGINAYGKGAWAPSLRYHNGIFYVLFGALDTGKTYLFSAKDPKGPWERTEFNSYMHDPSLLFDDNGRAYIIHGRTNLYITELMRGFKEINPAGLNKRIITTTKEGMEGSHAYKINEKYYIATIWWESGNIRRQFIFRSEQTAGPFEGRLALSDTMGYKRSGVAQGGLVDTPDGDWYAILFQDRDAVGRVPVLVPVRWEDGWPIYGNEEGRVPLEYVKPSIGMFTTQITRSDEFYQDGIIETGTASKETPKGSSLDIELVKNGEFSKGSSGWNSKEGARLEIKTENNNQLAFISNRRTTGAGIEQNFSGRIIKDLRYKARFNIRYTEGPERKEFILTARITANGQSSFVNLVRGIANKGEWTEISGSFTIKDTQDKLYLFIETPWVGNPEPINDTMNFYLDSISIRENPVTQAELDEVAPNGSMLGLHWQWNHNPNNTKWSLTDRKGFLRLRTASIAEDILQARNTLTQRTQGPSCSGWILIDTRNMLGGDFAGLAAFQQEYGFIGVTKENGEAFIVMVEKGIEKDRVKLLNTKVYFKIDFDFKVDRASFFYSYNGTDWTQFGSILEMRYTIPHFMGYRFAIFNYATKELGGYVDVDFFMFEHEMTSIKT